MPAIGKTRKQLLQLIERALVALQDQTPFEALEKWEARQDLCADLEAAILSFATPHVKKVRNEDHRE